MCKTNNSLLIVIDTLLGQTRLFAIHPSPAEREHLLHKLNGTCILLPEADTTEKEFMAKIRGDWRDGLVLPVEIERESFDYTYVIELM